MYSVVIPSKLVGNLQACVAAIKQNEPTLDSERIIVVDDSEDGDLRIVNYCAAVRCSRIKGIKPFIFSRNINAGVAFAIEQDPDVNGFVFCNDDALLESPDGFTLLHDSAAAHPDELGCIGAVTSVVGNPNQFPKGIGLRLEERMVCFFTVYVSRKAYEKVGPLCEEFTQYGMDDDSYCLELRRAGFKIGIHDGCRMDHGSLPSSFRGTGGAGGDFSYNLEVFKRKYGMDNWGRPA